MNVRRVTFSDVVTTLLMITFISGVLNSCVPLQNCYPPHCRCMETAPPTNEPITKIPQMVLFTFDDAVREQDLQWYKRLFSPNRKNPNGCPICMTLFLQDRYTNYRAVRELHQYGMEIAVHSVSHRIPSSFWQRISKEDFENEACKQKQNIHKKAGVPLEKIRGWRSPFLQPSGETQYSVLQSCNFTYDSTLTVSKRSLTVDTLWPFTLDFGWPLPCGVPPCPTSSYPGFWILPVVSLITSQQTPAVYVDAFRPNSVRESFDFLWNNFQSYYTKKRPPFMLNMHSAWFSFPHNLQAMDQFIQKLITLPDVYIITSQQALDWLENPVSLSRLDELPSWRCSHLNPIPRLTPSTVITNTSSSAPTFSITTHILPYSGKPIPSGTAVPSTSTSEPISSAITTDSVPGVPTLELTTTTTKSHVSTATVKLPLYTEKLYTTPQKPLVASPTSPSSFKPPLSTTIEPAVYLQTVTLKLPISTPRHALITSKKNISSRAFPTTTLSPTSVSPQPSSPPYTVSSTTPQQTVFSFKSTISSHKTFDTIPSLASVTVPTTTLEPAPTILPSTTLQMASDSSYSPLQTTTPAVPTHMDPSLGSVTVPTTTWEPVAKVSPNKTSQIASESSYSPLQTTTSAVPTQTEPSLAYPTLPTSTLEPVSTTVPNTTLKITSESYPGLQTTTIPVHIPIKDKLTVSSIVSTTTFNSRSAILVSDVRTLPTTLTHLISTNRPIKKTTTSMLSDTHPKTILPISDSTISEVSTEFRTAQTTSTPILLTKIIHHEEDKPTTLPQEPSSQDKPVLFLSLQVSVFSSVLIRLIWQCQ